MATQVTFTADFTKEALAQLHRSLGALIDGSPTRTDGASAQVVSDDGVPVPIESAPLSPDDAERMAKELRDSIGSNNQALVRQMTSYGDAEFTMPDVAGDMGVPEPTVQARFRNLCKVLNRLQEKYPTVKTWPAESRAGRWHFKASPAWREAVERAWR